MDWKKVLFRKWGRFLCLLFLPGLMGCGIFSNLAATPTMTPSPVPTPTSTPMPLSLEEAKQQYGLKVVFGDSADMIIAAYGTPSSDDYLPNFKPPVVREINYIELGLKFVLERDHLKTISFQAPFTDGVYGVRIGDSIDRILALYGQTPWHWGHEVNDMNYQEYEWQIHGIAVEKVPGGTIDNGIDLYVDMDNNNKVAYFYIYDSRFSGNWIPSP